MPTGIFQGNNYYEYFRKKMTTILEYNSGSHARKKVYHCLLVYATLHPAEQTGQLIPPNYASVWVGQTGS